MTNSLLSRKGSGKLLSVLIKYPKRKFSINELSKEAGLPFGSTWNILQEWERFRLVNMEKIGNTNAVSLGSGPHLKTAKALLELEKSPQRASLGAIARELKKKRVGQAFLFGSVVQGKEKPGSDIDIALVSPKGFDSAKEAIELEDAFAVKVMFVEFKKEKELLEFLKGKKHEGIL
jgi:predicted nucleotidyltransferase